MSPGCGSKLVIRTFRGIELGEMLTSTCPNAGCGKSVTSLSLMRLVEFAGGEIAGADGHPPRVKREPLVVGLEHPLIRQHAHDSSGRRRREHRKVLVSEGGETPHRRVEIVRGLDTGQ